MIFQDPFWILSARAHETFSCLVLFRFAISKQVLWGTYPLSFFPDKNGQTFVEMFKKMYVFFYAGSRFKFLKKANILSASQKRQPGLFSFWIATTLFFESCFFHSIFWTDIFQGHKTTHVFKTRIVVADWLGECGTILMMQALLILNIQLYLYNHLSYCRRQSSQAELTSVMWTVLLTTLSFR